MRDVVANARAVHANIVATKQALVDALAETEVPELWASFGHTPLSRYLVYRCTGERKEDTSRTVIFGAGALKAPRFKLCQKKTILYNRG